MALQVPKASTSRSHYKTPWWKLDRIPDEMKTNGSPVLPESANDYSGASKGVEVGEDGQIKVK